MSPNPRHPRTAVPSALLAAALSGALYFLGAFAPQNDGPAVETASADQIRSFLAAHDTGLRVGAAAAALAIPLVLVFTTSLARLIRAQLPGLSAGRSRRRGRRARGRLALARDGRNVDDSRPAPRRLRPGAGRRRDAARLVRDLQLHAHLRRPRDGGDRHGYRRDLDRDPADTVRRALARLARCRRRRRRGSRHDRGDDRMETAGRVWFVGIFGWLLWLLAVSIGCVVRLRRTRRQLQATVALA